MSGPVLTVQVVLYQGDPAQIRRQLDGVCAAARLSVREGAHRALHLAYGDSSPSPVMDEAFVAEVTDIGVGGGLASVSYTFFDANRGSGGGSNDLAAAGDTEFFLVLNPDTYPDPRLFIELAAAAAPPTVGAVDGRQLPIEHAKDFDLVTGDTAWVSGACMYVRRRAFEQVGGFADAYLPMYCDDVDMSWRLRLAGWRTVHAPRALVFHDKRLDPVGGVTPEATQTRLSAEAGLMMAHRWKQPERLDEILTYFRAQPDGPYRDALRWWEDRVAAGTIGDQVDGAERVATFINGGYERARY